MTMIHAWVRELGSSEIPRETTSVDVRAREEKLQVLLASFLNEWPKQTDGSKKGRARCQTSNARDS